MAGQARLIGLSKLNKGQEFPLEKNVKIGRSPECDIVMSTNSMSRQHAELKNTKNGFVLVDLGSHNGTFVNGEKIESCIIKEGDNLKIGGVRFQFKNMELSEEETPVAAPAVVDHDEPEEVVDEYDEQGVEVIDEAGELAEVVEDEDPFEEEGEIVDANQNMVNSSVFIGLLLLALGIGVFVLFKSFSIPEPEPKVIMIKLGANKLLDIEAFGRLTEETGLPDKFVVGDPTMMKAQFYKKGVRWMMQISPLQMGETTINIVNTRGVSFREINVIVSGRVQPLSKKYEGVLLTETEKLRQAKKHILKAKNNEESDMYGAKIEYEIAYNILNQMSSRGPLYVSTKTKLENLNEKIKNHIKLLWEQFHRSKYNEKYADALMHLESIIQFIHDEYDLNYQQALIYHNKVSLIYNRKKKK